MGDFVLTEEFQSIARPADEICTILTYSPDEILTRIQVQDLKNPTELGKDELSSCGNQSSSPDGTETPDHTEVPDDAEPPGDTETSPQSLVEPSKLPSTPSTQHFRARFVYYTG